MSTPRCRSERYPPSCKRLLYESSPSKARYDVASCAPRRVLRLFTTAMACPLERALWAARAKASASLLPSIYKPEGGDPRIVADHLDEILEANRVWFSDRGTHPSCNDRSLNMSVSAMVPL